MGFNTTIVILNDALHRIGQDPHFGQTLEQAVLQHYNQGRSVELGYENHLLAGNCGKVLSCAHADDTQVIAVGGNTGFTLGKTYEGRGERQWGSDEHKLLILKQLAAELGYSLRKTPPKK